MAAAEEFIFVYNADGNFFAGLTDFAHKIISPDTYACSLCKITYGNFAMKNEWKQFLAGLPQKKTFLHRDEFHRDYPQFAQMALPVILKRRGSDLSVMVKADELNSQEDIAQLKDMIKARI